MPIPSKQDHADTKLFIHFNCDFPVTAQWRKTSWPGMCKAFHILKECFLLASQLTIFFLEVNSTEGAGGMIKLRY